MRGDALRQYLALVILAAGISVALKQIAHIMDLPMLEDAAMYMLFGSAGAIATVIIVLLLVGYRKAKGDRSTRTSPADHET